MLVEEAPFKLGSNPDGSAGPAHNAIERVPAVIEQDATASHLWIDAPVCNSVRAAGDCRLRSQRPPADGSPGADGALVNQSRNLATDWCFEPVMHGVQDAPSSRGGPCHARRVLDPCDQRFFAEHVKAHVERALNQRR